MYVLFLFPKKPRLIFKKDSCSQLSNVNLVYVFYVFFLQISNFEFPQEMINKNTTPLSDLMKQKLYLTLGTFGYKVTNSKNKVLKQMDIAESMLNVRILNDVTSYQ